MKLPYPTLFLIALALAAKVPLICPDDDVSNCYPKIFEPSSEFQVVREGQHIPPGLHVRLNMETGEQEAKLLSQEENHNVEIVLVEDSHSDDTPVEQNSDETPVEQKSKDSPISASEERGFRKSHVNEAELSDFESSVKELLGFGAGGDVSRLEKALDTLIELSHDLEYGVALTHNEVIFPAMATVADMAGEVPGIAEKVYRIMGSSLRNNPEAVSNFLDKQEPQFVAGLYTRLQSGDLSEVLQKRILGVIQALTANTYYAYTHFNSANGDNADGLTKLIELFPSLGASAQERAVLILQDLKIVAPGEGTSAGRMSEYLQGLLQQSLCRSETQLQTVVHALVDLHKADKLAVGKEFLQWLSREAEERRSGTRKRDALFSNTNPGFDQFLASVRHAVFGNDKARKMDEL